MRGVVEEFWRERGNAIVTAETELGKLGFAICYDIRFPELFRLLALEGAQILFTPANFTLPTGKKIFRLSPNAPPAAIVRSD